MTSSGVAWITGGGSGLGRSLALELAGRGWDVAVSGRRADKLEAVAAEIRALGRRAAAVPVDVCDEAAVAAAVERVVGELGRLDCAVANAGFGVGGAFDKINAADWRRQFEVNVIGAVITARAAVPELAKTRGRLAIVGSVAGYVPTPGSIAYGASKAAIRSICDTLAVELAPLGVTCTAIHPGFVASEIAQVDNNGVYHPEWEDRRPKQLIWKTEDAARVMADGIEARTTELVFTGHGRLFAFLGRHFPGLTRLIFREATKRGMRA